MIDQPAAESQLRRSMTRLWGSVGLKVYKPLTEIDKHKQPGLSSLVRYSVALESRYSSCILFTQAALVEYPVAFDQL